MNATSLSENQENIFVSNNYRILKSAAIYGANASGKSNLIKSFSFFRWFILNSSQLSDHSDEIEYFPFLLDESSQFKPSQFDIEFITNGNKYRYGFEINKIQVVSEWLFETNKNKENLLFIRDRDIIEISNRFSEGEKLEDKTRPTSLFLSVVAQFNGKISTEIIKWFRNTNAIHGLNDSLYQNFTANMLKNQKAREALINFIKLVDLNISNFDVEERDFDENFDGANISNTLKKELIKQFKKQKQINIITKHKRYNKDFKPLQDEVYFSLNREESEGTRKFFNLAGPILDSVLTGKILFVDELEAKLHPAITNLIAKMFNSKWGNPKNAQIVFATHDSNLLSAGIFRRDQIWFTEKTRYESTDLYSLSEYKLSKDNSKVRKDSNYEINYLKGKYGAIPFLGNVYELINQVNGEKSES